MRRLLSGWKCEYQSCAGRVKRHLVAFTQFAVAIEEVSMELLEVVVVSYFELVIA